MLPNLPPLCCQKASCRPRQLKTLCTLPSLRFTKLTFFLSWNFKHIANPVIQAKIAAKLQAVGLALPFICPPEELLGEDDD